MRAQDRSRQLGRKGEQGHLMAGLIAAITIMLLFSTITFQAWEDVIRRDNEAEMIFRGKEIARGIMRYRKDHAGMGPLTLEQLAEPGPQGQYYMRRLYEDPLVKDGKWGLLYLGPGGNIIDPSAQLKQPEQGLPALNAGFDRAAPVGDQLEQVGVSGGNSGGIGIPIAGVKTLCTDDPFRMFNGVLDYSQWQFTYIDLQTGLASASAPGRGMQRGVGGQAGGAQGQPPGLPQQGSSDPFGNKKP
jgi:hypothetical protein